MQAILAFIGANGSYFSIGALCLSLFCAGSMLQGERLRKEEIREQMREIEAMTETTMARVAEINTRLEAQDQALVAEIETTYGELAALSAEESEARRALARSQQQLNRPRTNTPSQPASPRFQGFDIREN